jgi:hypothetical protein
MNPINPAYADIHATRAAAIHAAGVAFRAAESAATAAQAAEVCAAYAIEPTSSADRWRRAARSADAVRDMVAATKAASARHLRALADADADADAEIEARRQTKRPRRR